MGGTDAGLTTYGYNDNDWLMSETVDGVLTSYTYSSNGNTQTTVTNGIETANYLYDSEDRMTVANITDSGLTTIGNDLRII